MFVQTRRRYGLRGILVSLRTVIIICAFFFLFFIFPEPIAALQVKTIENDQIIVQYDESLHTAAQEIVKKYPLLKRELEETFRFKTDFRPTVVLFRSRKDFQERMGSRLAVAVALPQKNLIVVDNSKMKTHPFTLEITLKHELCHLLLYHYIGGKRMPKWLNEGISQWVTGGMSEIIGVESKDLLKQATLSGRFITLDNLTNRFPGDEKSLHLAYQQSRSIVEYIVRESGFEGVLKILAKLREGDDMDNATGDVLSTPLYELEKKWHAHLKTKYTWLVYVSSHIFQLLFAFASVILVYGFIKFIIRKRQYRDEEDEIDAEDDHFMPPD